MSNRYTPDMTQGMVGAQPAFQFPRDKIMPGLPMPQIQSGGQGGVPGSVGSVVPDSGGSAQAALDAGQQAAAQPAHNQPLWYGFVFFALGGIMLAHAAWHETRRR